MPHRELCNNIYESNIIIEAEPRKHLSLLRGVDLKGIIPFPKQNSSLCLLEGAG